MLYFQMIWESLSMFSCVQNIFHFSIRIMNIFFIMLKLLHDFESKLIYKILSLVRESSLLGGCYYAQHQIHQQEATLDDIQILHDSPHFIVLNKYQDVLINHADKNVPVTVEKQLERLYPDLVDPSLSMSFFFCHRLDYSTSGILCIAKHKKACAAAVDAFTHRTTSKFYLAITRGHISQDVLTVNEGIGEDVRESFRKIRMASASSPFCSSKWRNAITHIAVLERGYCFDYPATKILIKPITGRRHQIRLHCSQIGHTIVGDYTYSNRKDLCPHRMFLHAYKLVLPNRIEPLSITTSDPFTPHDARNKWIPFETLKSIDEAMIVLQEDR